MNNIKTLYFGLVLIIVGLSTYGQSSKFDIGVEGGPSLIFLRGDDLNEKLYKPNIGYSGGLFFQYNFKKIVSLRTNISYERKGAVLNAQLVEPEANIIGEVTSQTNFDYLTLPLLVRGTFGRKVHFFLNTGPYFGFLTKQTFIIKDTKNPTKKIDNTSFLDKRFDIGITTGIGLSIPIKTNFLISFETRNNLGLYNTSAFPIAKDLPVKTNSTNFLLGFAYKLGQRALDNK